MNFIEYHEKISQAIPLLTFNSKYISGDQEFNYETSNLSQLRKGIHLIEDLPIVENEVKDLKTSWLFESTVENQKITNTENSTIISPLSLLKIKLSTLKDIAERSKIYNNNQTILIRIPEIQSFDKLIQYGKDFKKAIEIPIIDESIGGDVTILSADEGSVIFYVALGSVAAVKLVAGICWAAGVIKKKNAEANIFEEHARTLELKNEALEIFVNAQKAQMKNILDAEAKAIANNMYNHNEPETIERLKLSITTVSELIDKGVNILPVSKDEDIQKSFPDYTNLNLIESTIKKLGKDN